MFQRLCDWLWLKMNCTTVRSARDVEIYLNAPELPTPVREELSWWLHFLEQ